MRCTSSRFLTAVPLALGGVQHLAGQALGHGLLAALARGIDQPAHGQRLAARRAHFHRHLVGRAADAAGLHLDHRADVVQRLLEASPAALLTALGDLSSAP
jgi:hypothetical protein